MIFFGLFQTSTEDTPVWVGVLLQMIAPLERAIAKTMTLTLTI